MSFPRPLSCSAATSLPERSSSYRWSHNGTNLEIAITQQGGEGPAWLLLPALSTISSRQEWQPFCAALSGDPRWSQAGQVPQLIQVDWPGFGDSDRPRLAYDAALLAQALAAIRRDCCPKDCGLISAGHGAGIALLAAERHGLQFREWVLVAPTWRGPLPTMARRQSRAFPLIRALLETPLLGPLLYRLNTSRSLIEWMGRRHVDLAGPGLTPAGIAQRQAIARQPGARFASAAFVTGGLDPYDRSDGWLAAAKNLKQPLTVVIADNAPPRSWAEMGALAALADRVLHLPGRLGAHQEFGRDLAQAL